MSQVDRVDARPLRWSPSRVATGGVMAAWAFLFWFLIASDRSLLYVSTRTQWVVPLGAITLTAAAIGRFAGARTTDPEPLVKREAWVLGLMILPVVALLAMPPVALGSYAVQRRSSFVKSGVSVSAEDIANSPLSLISIASSPATELGQKALAQHAGETVTFEGFVNRFSDTPADEFYLTRFVVTCCVADATIASVRIVDVTPGKYVQEDWVRVTGTFYPIGKEAIVDADVVAPIPRPNNPYLTP